MPGIYLTSNSLFWEISQCELFSNFLQSSRKLVETNVKVPLNSRNGSLFKKEKNPSYPPISMLNLGKFCCHQPKTSQTTLNWGGEGIFQGNFFFSSFVQDCRLLIIFEIFEITEKYQNVYWHAVCFKSDQVQVIKVVFMN